jgi:hypothetical protein
MSVMLVSQSWSDHTFNCKAIFAIPRPTASWAGALLVGLKTAVVTAESRLEKSYEEAQLNPQS